MTPEDWQRVKELFHSALAQQADERAAFLAEVCGDDLSIRKEVESLIAAYEKEEDFIATPIFAGAAKLLVDTETKTIEQHIGPYKIIREIGHGGMGTVYLGVRANDFQKRVAIKLVKRGMDSKEIIRRFQKERQILANLDHLNIAKLLDGGTTPDGLPYFVMEYIEGKPVDEYCDSNQLSITERLKLFLAVCSGVQYSHQNLIVHRDMKPGNILVTNDGVPKLLDFGIAKVLNAEFSDATIDPTATMFRLMTPEYASPEQVRGETITAASDVYSLGVLLYELLTGHRPYRIKSRLSNDILKAVCEEEPDKPSLAINRVETMPNKNGTTPITLTPELVSKAREGWPDKLRRRLNGDLDNIIMMAMRKEAKRRYNSVEQFAEDIRRHLAGHPVIARKDTFSYRSAKFIRRNKFPLAIASLLLCALIGVFVTIIVQSARIARERDKAQRVSAFLVELFETSEPNKAQGNVITAQDILDKGAERIINEFNDQPEIQAKLMGTMGTVYFRQGLYDKALPLLEGALKINRQTFGNKHQEVASCLNNLGLLFMEKGNYQRAKPLLHEALAINRQYFGNKDLRVAANLNNLAIVSQHKGEYRVSETYYREAVAIRRELLGNEHPDVAKTINNLSGALREIGEYGEAEQLAREAIAIYKKSLGPDGISTSMANAISNLATIEMEIGNYDTAEPLFRQAVTIKRKLLGKEHFEIARSLNGLAMVCYEKGDYATAQSLLTETIAMFEKLLREHQLTAISKKNLARVREANQDYQEAERLYRQSLSMNSHLLGDKHPNSVLILNHLATLLANQGDYNAAESLLRQALALGREALPAQHTTIATSLLELGRLLTNRGAANEAEPLLREALAIRRKRLPKDHWLIADAESVLGGCLTALQRYQEAEELLVASYPRINSSRGGERSQRVLQALNRIIKLYQGWNKPAKTAQYRALLTLTKSTKTTAP
ncbi:MAG: serine/threonine-protein kinase [Acidobacteriota bacterium]